MRNRFGSEHGQVLVIAAVAIPVFLLLTALVIDTGNWFSHKRQLQNRADAAALAAGVEYGLRWAACSQNGNAALKASSANAIESVARRFAGDPTARPPIGYDPTSPANVNTEVANQGNLDVIINSTSYTAGTDYSDGGGPCFDHPTDNAAEGESNITPQGGAWVDVKVKERDTRSLFGLFGIDLFQNIARARVWVGSPKGETGFVPLAVPETEIIQAQLRYYDYCNPANPQLLLKRDLVQLSVGYQTGGAMTYWGPTAAPSGETLNLPVNSSCSGDYIPVATEVRIAGRGASVVDIDTPTCAALNPKRFADCFTRLSTIRVWKDAPATTQAWIQGLTLTAGGTCAPDGLFARNTPASCTFAVSVDVDWQNVDNGTRGGNNCPTSSSTSCLPNFHVDIRPAGGGWTALAGPAGITGPWTGTLTNAQLGRGELEVRWSWVDRDTTHTAPGGGACRNGGGNPCNLSGGAYDFSSVFLADDTNAGVIDLVRTSGTGQASGGAVGAPLASARAGTSLTVYPTVGLRSSLNPGQFRILRAAGPQGNQSLDCEPSGGQGHDFQMFLNGCQPFYGPNSFTQGTWWNTSNLTCPSRNTIFSQPNSENEFWECVVAAPGFSSSVIADGIAARTGNCTRIQNNSCGRTQCLVPNDYQGYRDGTSVFGNGYANKRVIKLFIVPYGAFKGVNAQDGLPISKFAAFYVTGWGGNGANADPCTSDPDGTTLITNADGTVTGTAEADYPAQTGEIAGYFVEEVAPGGGTAVSEKCVPGQLTPCSAVLVR